MQRTTLAAAIIQGKCPRCRSAKIFAHRASNLIRFSQMNQVCPHCGVRLEPEPGFYQGAMYVSYGFTVAFILIIGAILYFAGVENEWTYVGTSIAVMILLAPLNYRISRVIYLYAFGGIKYDPSLSK